MTRFSQQKLVKSIATFRSVIAGVQLGGCTFILYKDILIKLNY